MKHDDPHIGLTEVETQSVGAALELVDASELATYPIDEGLHYTRLLVATTAGLVVLTREPSEAREFEACGAFTAWNDLKARLTWTSTLPGSSGWRGAMRTVGTLALPDLKIEVSWTRDRTEEWHNLVKVVREHTAPSKREAR